GVAAEVLVHVAARQEARLFAHREAGAAAAAQAGVFELLEDLVLLDVLIALQGDEAGILGSLEQDAGLERVRHQLDTSVSPASGRFSSDFSGSTASPASSWSIAVCASPGSSGPKYRWSIEAIGAMSQAPRH